MSGVIPKRRSVLGTLVQIGGFTLGIAALAWCVHLALKPEHQDALSKLRGMTLADAAILAGLTVVSFALNGLCFWATIRAQKRLKPIDVIATNCLATLLAVVPFKASLIFRLVIHNRRDHVPLLTIGAWFAAVGLGMMLVLGPIIAATMLRGQIDPAWQVLVFTGIPVLSVLAIVLARQAAGEVGLARIQRIAAILPTSLPRKFTASNAFMQLHSGCSMVGSPWFATNLAFRMLDVIVQAARFHIIATVLGVDVNYANSLLLSSSYFLIGVLAPSGTAGSREGGITGLAKLRAIPGWQSIAPVALTVGACELIILLILAPFAALILKPWKLRQQPPLS